MSIDAFIAKLAALDVRVWVQDGRLRCSAPQSALTPDLREELSRRKDELIAALGSASADAAPAEDATIRRVDRNAPLELSSGQQRLWFISRMAEGEPLFNLPFVYRLRGPLDAPALARAVDEVVRRHESLRTVYELRDGRPVQRVLDSRTPVEVEDRPTVAAEREAVARALAAAESGRAFDLAIEPPLRARLVRFAADDHLFALTLHHIGTDAWSFGIMRREIGAVYAAAIQGRAASLPDLPVQYADFAAWQRSSAATARLARQIAYWRTQLAGVTTGTELPTDRPRAAVQTTHGAAATRRHDRALFDAVRRVAQRNRVTPFMALLTAWAIVLRRFSGQSDVVLGTPVTSRTRRELEGLIGFFVNSLVLRVDAGGDPTIGELIARVRDVTLAAHANQDVPFERLVEELQVTRDLSRHPFFQTDFVVHQASAAAEWLPGIAVEPAVSSSKRSAPTDLTLEVTDSEESPSSFLVYNTDLFDEATAVRLLDQFELALDAIGRSPDARLSELPALTGADAELLAGVNRTGAAYPQGSTLHGLFEEQADASPDRVAILDERGQATTYAQARTRARAMAGRLRAAGVGRGSLVAVCVERSPALITTLLGVLEAGAAYVPLDPSFPVERLRYMLDDSAAAALVVDETTRALFDGFTGPLISIDQATSSDAPSPAAVAVAPGDLAYVIYTSGSTGRPKGVAIPHRAIVNFLSSMKQAPGLRATDVLVAVTTASFDIAGLEMFLPLVTGASVVVATRGTAGDPQRLLRILEERGATAMQATPATWRMLVDAGWRGRAGLEMLCGGEAMPRDLAEALLARGTSLWNLYGPTETTVWSTVEHVTRLDRPVSIGAPIANTTVHVLDDRLRPVPVGVFGEIFIGGDGVATGYLNRPDLTADRFVPDPFASRAGARMYRTGDLGRVANDGRIEYVGRADHQVKIRGFRIELGEIEAVLAGERGIVQAVVHPHDDGSGPRLVAYFVAESGAAVDVESIRGRLSAVLPQYMVPAVFVPLPALPLTANGKIDRKALPAPDARPAATSFVPPRTAIEQTIAAIWREVLRLDTVGVDDNFFEIGGHSLLLVQVQARLSTALGRPVPVVDLFQFPTIAALARHFGGAAAQDTASSDAHDRVARRRGSRDAEGIAIVSLAGRFPGAATIEAFWNNLREGVEGIRFFSDEELRAAGVPDALLQLPTYVRARGFLEGTELFDASFFELTPREATVMDPQHRLFLEASWEALERAGCNPETYPGLIGVFAGSSLNTYLPYALAQGGDLGLGATELMLNADKDHLATRVSYKLNLRGPAITVQTACSTSLVAVHVACQSLLAYECDMALAGGVSAVAPPVGGYVYDEGSIASPDGHCRPFDARAQGTVGGCGVGIVALKRLSDAIADGDVVHAVIRGTAINNDGSNKVGYTAPSVEGQARAIALAQAAAGCDPATISYIEAHGTATHLGDPIEVRALDQVFGQAVQKRAAIAIGSVKSNIGHLDAAAGVAGLIKTTLALEHRALPPSLHYEQSNPEIDFDATPFYVNTRLQPWTPPDGAPRRAGVSSFGLGGTNAHVVVEEAPERPPSGPSRPWQILLVSARSEAALARSTAELSAAIRDRADLPLADVAYTLAVGRRAFAHRRAVIARAGGDAIDALDRQPPLRSASALVRSRPRVVFMFPGQGAQHIGMARELYETEGVFREQVDAGALRFENALGLDLRELLFNSDAGDDAARATLTSSSVAQASLFVVEYALARLWMSWGITPDALIGHSIGEYVAACLSGVLPYEDAIALVALRGRLMDAAPDGAMLAVGLAEADARELVGDGVWLASVNAPASCVLAGTREALEAVRVQLERNETHVQWLHTSGAFHSGLMDSCVRPLNDAVSRIAIGRPAIPFISNVTGDWFDERQLGDPGYWGRHLAQTVRFADGVSRLAAWNAGVLLEVGPGQTLAGIARQQFHGSAAPVIASSLRHPRADTTDGECLARAIAQCWSAGATPDWTAYFAGEQRHRVVLPTYPFERRRFWVDRNPAAARTERAAFKRSDVADWFYTPSWKRTMRPRLAEHERSGGRVWLALVEAGGVSGALADRLAAAGDTVIRVRRGDAFVRDGGTAYTVRPAERSDYEALLRDVTSSGAVVTDVLHAWLAAPEDRRDDLDAIEESGFFSLLALAQAVGESMPDTPLRLSVVTTGVHDVAGTEPLIPEKSTVLGPCRVLPFEYPNLRVRHVDLTHAEWSGAAADWTPVVLELQSSEVDPAVAYRHGRRWTLAYEPVRVELVAAPAVGARAGGVYLITGGTGGIGLEIARSVAERGSATLVLVSRRGLPNRDEWNAIVESGADTATARAIRAVHSVEERGVTVRVHAADVADRRAMRSVVSETLREFGRIDGVVHAAGVPGGGLAQLKKREAAAQVLAPKVEGTRVLLDAIADTPTDFVLLCSSITSVQGGVGQVDYCAANAYLDAAAAAASRTGRRVIAVNWAAWQEVGMAVNTAIAPELLRARNDALRLGIAPAEGVDAFHRVVARASVPQVIVSPAPLVVSAPVRPEPRTERVESEAGDSPAASGHARPELAQAYAAPRNEIEEAVAAVWSELFGIDRVGIDDNFFELGGHSLLATQLASRLRRTFDVPLTLEVVFEAQTVAGQAAAILEKLLEAESGEDGTPLLDDLEALSSEQIQRELERNRVG